MNYLEYDGFEKFACNNLPNRIIEAFKPEAFQIVGYPITVKDEVELYKYVDVMHESTFEVVYSLFLQGITNEEFSLLKIITLKIIEYTLEKFNKVLIPKNSILVALTAYRHIKALYPNKNSTILEVGPGSGYLGLMLGLDGYNHISTDSCQAFYCLQSSVYSYFFGNKFLENASDSRSINEIFTEKSKDQNVIHLPWWKFASAQPLSINLSIDCVVCVNMIAEMQIMAFRYLARQAYRWLSSNNNGKKYFILMEQDLK